MKEGRKEGRRGKKRKIEQHSNRLAEKVSLLFVALALSLLLLCPSLVMSTASTSASSSSVVTVSSGASGSTAVPPAASAPPSTSTTTSTGLYSQLFRSLDDPTRRQIEAAMARALLSPSTPLPAASAAASGMHLSHSLSCTHT